MWGCNPVKSCKKSRKMGCLGVFFGTFWHILARFAPFCALKMAFCRGETVKLWNCVGGGKGGRHGFFFLLFFLAGNKKATGEGGRMRAQRRFAHFLKTAFSVRLKLIIIHNLGKVFWREE